MQTAVSPAPSSRRHRGLLAGLSAALVIVPAGAQEVQGPPDGFLSPGGPATTPPPAQGPDNGGIAPIATPPPRTQPVPTQPRPAAPTIVVPAPQQPAPLRPQPQAARVPATPPAATGRPAPVTAAPDTGLTPPQPVPVTPDQPLAVPPLVSDPVGPAARPAPPVTAPGGGLIPWWPWALTVLGLIAAGVWWLSRTRAAAAIGSDAAMATADVSAPTMPPKATAPRPLPRAEPVSPQPAPPPVAPPVVTEPPRTPAPAPQHLPVTGRAQLDMALRVDEIEMLADRARISFALMLTNRGELAATGGLVRIALQQAHRNQDAMLARFFDGAGGSVVAEDLNIAPGAVEVVQRSALLPLDQVEPMLIGGYPSLIPVAGFDVTYHWDGDGDAFGQVAGAYVLGTSSANDGRVAPIRLDQGPRRLAKAAARATELQRTM